MTYLVLMVTHLMTLLHKNKLKGYKLTMRCYLRPSDCLKVFVTFRSEDIIFAVKSPIC